MGKLRGFIQTAFLISALFVASIAAAGYLVFAPLQNFELTAPPAYEETYSSESLPSPQLAAFGFDSVISDLKRSPDPTPARQIKPSQTPLKNLAYVSPVPTKTSQVPSPTPIPLPAGGVNSKVETVYYDIYGDTETELRNEMNEKGHPTSDGETYDAYTQWQIGWKYWNKNETNSCAVGSVQVAVDIEILLPRWSDESGAEDSLKSKWNTYMEALTAHENTHRDFALSGAQSMYDALLRLSPQSTCEELQSKVSETGQGFIGDIDNKNKAFDAETNHGKNQGAVFP